MQLLHRFFCTGCAACQGACNAGCISMRLDDEGFLQPAIDREMCTDCGLCARVCPHLNPPTLERLNQPEIYAVRACDEIRFRSSSGGVFPLLAKDILSRGGVVAGAIIDYEDNLNVKHVVTDDELIVRSMSSSKYVQSEMSDKIFRGILFALQGGRDVLFSGCPCQVAGLYGYLGGASYQGSLYTMDFFCHGVPSPDIFRKYLRENFGGRLDDIERFDFRDKSVFGWSTCINVYFKDGTEQHIDMDDDPYMQLFLPCAIQRPSCSHCGFSSLPRYADISVGDFWGCGNYKTELDDGKGTSFALVNSLQGQSLFNRVRNEIALIDEEVPLEAILPLNPTPIHPFEPHPGRAHVFKYKDTINLNKLAEHALHFKFDVGVVSLWYRYDDVALSTYALVRMLENDRHDVLVLDKPGYVLNDDELYNNERTPREFLASKCLVSSRRAVSWQEMEHNENCRALIFMGCQINDEECNERERDYFEGLFVSPANNKIILNEHPVWLPALLMSRDEYLELANCRDGGVSIMQFNIHNDKITRRIINALEGLCYKGDAVLPVVIAVACHAPFTYTGDDSQLKDVLVQLELPLDCDESVTSVDWAAVENTLESMRRRYREWLYKRLDNFEHGNENDRFISKLMSETLEAHRKSDRLRHRVEDLENRIKLIEDKDIYRALNRSMLHRAISLLKNNGLGAVVNKLKKIIKQYAHNKRYDVGIVGLWYGKNYGSILTYYALYHVVEQLGYKVVMLDKPATLWDESFNDDKEIAQQFIRKYCNIAPRFNSVREESRLSSLADTFLVGSDVVWNYNICGRESGHFFFLDFAGRFKRKVSFAASLGEGFDNASESYIRSAVAYLHDFDCLSVREKDLQCMFKDKYGIETAYVLDPVFLVDKQVYDAFADKGTDVSYEHYFMSYMLELGHIKFEMQRYISNETGQTCISYKNPIFSFEEYSQKYSGARATSNIRVEDWLNCIRNASLFFGDSYHGLCFSLIFERPFIIFLHRSIKGVSRFETLLAECGLTNRLIFTDDPYAKEKIDDLLQRDIDWIYVRERLASRRAYSMKWLKEAL